MGASGPSRGPSWSAPAPWGTPSQGYSVSLSADGNTAIVGGFDDNAVEYGSGVGAAWVWTRSGGVWTQQGPKLVGTGAVGIALPRSFRVPLRRRQHRHRRRVLRQWVCWGRVGLDAEAEPSGPAGDQAGRHRRRGGPPAQGSSVSLSADGNTGHRRRVRRQQVMGPWVWTRSGGVWTQQGVKLVGTGAVGAAGPGASVSLSADGNTAIVGGLARQRSCWGRVDLDQERGVWTQQGQQAGRHRRRGDRQQGSSVSLSADGNTAIVGGLGRQCGLPGPRGSGPGAGVSGPSRASSWSAPARVGSPARATPSSLSADGNTAMVGRHYDNSSTLGRRGSSRGRRERGTWATAPRRIAQFP